MTKKIPEIRFPGFDGEWEEKKLENLALFSKGRGYTKSDLIEEGNPIILYGSMYTDHKYLIDDVKTYANLQNNSVISNGGEVIIPSSGETPEDISIASTIKNAGVIIGGDLNIIKPNGLDSLFLAISLSNGSNKKELSSKAEGATISHLKNNDIKNSKIIYPTLTEQEKIGSLFEKIDSLIEGQERAVDSYKGLKKSLLQKMFPREGEKIPQLRFPGFDGEWEEVQLSQLGKIQTGKTPNTSDKDNYSDDGILFVTPTDINGLIVKDSERKLSNKGILKTKIAKKNSILITCIASIGKNAITYEDVGFNQQINSIELNKNNDPYFFLTSSIKISHKIKSFASSGMMQIINKTDFSNVTTLVPSLPEQKKIGDLFKKLDGLIKDEEKYLEDLKVLKKALLQKMFV